MVGSRKSSTPSISTSRPASTRAAPRASSRSRHNFPVAECDTPRNAAGASTGNADAGSVMMLSAGKHEARRFNDSLATARLLAAHPVGYPRKIPGDDIPIALRLEIVFLQG